MSTVLDTLITDRSVADLAADLDKVYADYICLNRVEEACAPVSYTHLTLPTTERV